MLILPFSLTPWGKWWDWSEGWYHCLCWKKHEMTLPMCCFGLGGQEDDEFSYSMMSSLPLHSCHWQDREHFPFRLNGPGDLENKVFIQSAKDFFWLCLWIVNKTTRRPDMASFSVRLTQAFGQLEADHSLLQGNVSNKLKLSYAACAEATESWRWHLWNRNVRMARWKCPASRVSCVSRWMSEDTFECM